jgi:lysophospholipase
MLRARLRGRAPREPAREADLVATAGNGPPEGLTSTFLTTRDGMRLRAAHLSVPQPRGTVVIVNGRGDFIERWFETIGDLARRRYAVAIFDFRGQGGSQRRYKNPRRDSVHDFREYENDLGAVMTQLVLPDCPPPYFALGHSTGGLIVLRSLRKRTWFQKAVLSAPFLGINRGLWPMPLVRLLCNGVPLFGLGSIMLPGQGKFPLGSDDFPGNNLTSHAERFRRATATLDARPELGLGGASYSWLRAALSSIDSLTHARKPVSFRAPVLIVAAGQDRIVDTESARQFARHTPGVAFTVIPEARHEILSEADPIREQFYAAFDSFIAE